MLPIIYELDKIIEKKITIILHTNFCSDVLYIADMYNNITFALQNENYNIALFYNKLALEYDPKHSTTLIAQLLLEKIENNTEDTITEYEMLKLINIYYISNKCLLPVFILASYMETIDNTDNEFISDYGLFLDNVKNSVNICYSDYNGNNIQYILHHYFLICGNYDPVVKYIKKTKHVLKNEMILALKSLSIKHYIDVKYPINYDYRTDNCCICIEDIDTTINTSKLVCGHYFHHVCIMLVDTCPLCRGELLFR